MPEGDAIHRAARRIDAALVGKPIVEIETPQRRHALDRWPERLDGRAVSAVDAHGKHLFIRFEGDLTVHSHLRMTGAWGVYRRGERWRRSPGRAWLVIRTAEHDVVALRGDPCGATPRGDGPVLELMTESRTRFDRRLAALGPDVLAPELDEQRLLARLRGDDQTRGLGDALLDQRNLAGVGNVWKSEGCFATGIDPWRPLGRVSDEEALAVAREIRRLMQASVEGSRALQVYEHAGRPCPRCGATIRARGQGDDNRTTYWCPACQVAGRERRAGPV
jgi:endonuclease-8